MLAYLAKYDVNSLPNRTWLEVDESLRTKVEQTKQINTTYSHKIEWKHLSLRTLSIDGNAR